MNRPPPISDKELLEALPYIKAFERCCVAVGPRPHITEAYLTEVRVALEEMSGKSVPVILFQKMRAPYFCVLDRDNGIADALITMNGYDPEKL